MHDAPQQRRRSARTTSPATGGAPADDDTRVVIADAREFDRLALEILCEDTGHVTVSASVGSVSDAVRALRRGAAVVLIGRRLLQAEGPASISRIRTAGAARVILVGTGDHGRLGIEALRVGADGVLARDGDDVSPARVLLGESGAVPRWAEN